MDISAATKFPTVGPSLGITELEDRIPVFLSRRIQQLLAKSLGTLTVIPGYRFSDIVQVQTDDLDGYSGWYGEAVYAFHGAKAHFCDSFAQDIANDREDMQEGFKASQRDAAGVAWTAEQEAMTPAVFWVDDPSDSQDDFEQRWEDNPGDLFSLQLNVSFRLRDDAGNKSGADEIEISAGLNVDYVVVQRGCLLRAHTEIIILNDLNRNPRLLMDAFAVVDEFFANLT